MKLKRRRGVYRIGWGGRKHDVGLLKMCDKRVMNELPKFNSIGEKLPRYLKRQVLLSESGKNARNILLSEVEGWLGNNAMTNIRVKLHIGR